MNKKADRGGCNPLRPLICPILHIILSVILYIKIAEHCVITVFLSNFEVKVLILLRLSNFSHLANNSPTLELFPFVYITNRFHVAVSLFSNRLQTTSKCENKEVVHSPVARVTSSVIYY